MKTVHLDHDWRYFPTEDLDPAYGASQLDESSWGVLNDLKDVPRDVVAFYGTLHLKKTFDLEPIGEVCLRYHLHLESAPPATQVFVNGWHVGTTQAEKALVSDVTDYVTLEGNVILLKVSRKKGDIGAVYLLPIPCAGV